MSLQIKERKKKIRFFLLYIQTGTKKMVLNIVFQRNCLSENPTHIKFNLFAVHVLYTVLHKIKKNVQLNQIENFIRI